MVFAYDMQNTKKSFKGKPTTNLLYDTTNFSSAANEWNAQENVTVTRGQIAPDGQIQINCVKVKCNSATDSYFGVRSSALTNGNAIHSFSFWAKANKNFTMPIKFGSNQYTATVNLTQNWQYFSVSCPANLGLSVYLHFGGWGSLTDNTLEFYVYQPMYEESSFSTQFVPGGTSRSNTQALIDLTGNNTITASSLTYASDGTFSFNGGNYIDINNTSIVSGNNPFTVDAFYTTTGSTSDEIFGNYGSGYTSGNLWISGRYGIFINGSVYFPGAPIGAGTYHLCATRDSNGNVVLYKNGIQVNSGVLSASIPSNVNFRIGADVNGAAEPFTGKIYSVKVYNRVLTAAEVKQNFNALRGRYGL